MRGRLLSLLGIFFILTLGHARMPASRIECVAGCGERPLGGPALEARLIEPFGVAFDGKENWYICEYKGHRITRVTGSGVISLFAGTEKPGYGGDGAAAAQASFNEPHGLVIGNGGQLYVADTRNHRVRKVDLKTGAITTIAGTGKPGYSGDGGPAIGAQFDGVFGIDISKAGDRIYVADLGNKRVRVVSLKSGEVRTVAGNGQAGVPADGADAAGSPLVDPRAVTVDSKGNLYILERGGDALRIVDKQGKIRTLIGPAETDQPPMHPKLNGPKHLCVDLEDNVIVADSENHLVRKFTPSSGKTVTIAGTGQKGARLAPEDPLKTQLNRPHGVYVHPSGALYISDSDNNRILKLTGW